MGTPRKYLRSTAKKPRVVIWNVPMPKLTSAVVLSSVTENKKPEPNPLSKIILPVGIDQELFLQMSSAVVVHLTRIDTEASPPVSMSISENPLNVKTSSLATAPEFMQREATSQINCAPMAVNSSTKHSPVATDVAKNNFRGTHFEPDHNGNCEEDSSQQNNGGNCRLYALESTYDCEPRTQPSLDDLVTERNKAIDTQLRKLVEDFDFMSDFSIDKPINEVVDLVSDDEVTDSLVRKHGHEVSTMKGTPSQDLSSGKQKEWNGKKSSPPKPRTKVQQPSSAKMNGQTKPDNVLVSSTTGKSETCTKPNNKRHDKQASDGLRYRCQLCQDRGFAFKQRFRNHMWMYHKCKLVPLVCRAE